MAVTDILEREVELSALLERVDHLMTAGAGGAVLIEGVPGIGKSALLRATLDIARGRDGLTVLEAHGSELEFELTFGGVRQLLGRAVLELGPDELADVLSGPAALAAPVLGLPADSPPHGLSDPLYGLFWLVTNLTEGHASAATRLKVRGAPLEEIAAHLLAGEPARDAGNVRILRTAADEALAAVAPRAAARYLGRAVAEDATDGDELRALLLDLGRLQRLTSHPDAPATLTRTLQLSRTPEHKLEAAIELAAGMFAAADYAAVGRVADQMAGVEAAPDDRLMLDMLHAEARWAGGDWQGCCELIDRVPPNLPGETPAQRFALVQSASVRLMRGARIDEVLEPLLRAVGDRGADALVAGVDVGDPVGWLIQCDAFDEARAVAEERLEVATGDPQRGAIRVESEPSRLDHHL